MQGKSDRQRISWRLGPVTPAQHSKVSRTYSVCDDASLTNNAWLLTPSRDLPVDVRSSPDGSAGNSDERQPTTVNKQIDEKEEEEEETVAAVTLRDFCCGSSEMSSGGCESRGKQPDAVPHGRSPVATGSGQPYPQQEDSLHLSVTDGPTTEGDAKSSPVASDSRDELLQCEMGAFALEDVLRHYWLLSDHDDDAHRMKLRREPVYSHAFDWPSKRSQGNAPSYLESKSPEPSSADVVVVVQDVASSFQYEERDEDADSVVTLSTISEEDSEEISSTDVSHRMTTSLFGNTEPKFRDDNDRNDADILKESENFVDRFEGFSANDLSAIRDDDDDNEEEEEETSSENSEYPEIRMPDGRMESEGNEFSYSSSAFDSLVRTFSRYVSDIYPYSPAFISHQKTSIEGDDHSREGGHDAEISLNTHKESGTRLKDDNRGKLQLVLQETDSLKNSAAASDGSAEPWHSANGSGNVSTVASPTSWHTVSDVFDAQSFETASENMVEDGSADAGGSTAYAKCTAFARYDDETNGFSSDPKFRSSVTARVTADDPIVALSKAAARAATLAASEVVRSCDRCPGNIEVALTANCAIASQFGDHLEDNDDDDAQLISETDVAFERIESHAAVGGHHVTCSLSKPGDAASISTQRFNSATTKNALSDAETEEAMSNLDHDEFSCGIAIPHTRNSEISRCKELDVGSVTDVQDFAANPDKCEVASAGVLDYAKIKKSRSKKESADVEIVLSGIRIVTDGDDDCQTYDVVASAVTNSTAKTSSASAGIQTTPDNRSNCCATHGAVKLENFSENLRLDRDKMQSDNKKPATRSPNECLDGVKRLEASRSSHQMTRSLSHLLETDIDTLEHRRTEVSRNCSVSSVPDCKSYHTNLVSPQQESEISNDFCLWNSSAPSFNKEALEEMLSDWSPVGYFTKGQSNWSSNSPKAQERYASEPNLQRSVDKGRVSSSDGKVDKRYGKAERSFDGVSSGENDNKALHKCSSERINSNIVSPERDENSKPIERYDCSPSLRRRSLSLLSTPSSGRYGVLPGTPPEMQRRLGQDRTRTKTPDSRRRSLRPVSSSFENLVDSLLGITAIMSMETAASYSRPLFASRGGPDTRRRGDSLSDSSSPLSIQRRNFATRSPTGHDETRGNQGTGAPLAALSGCSDSVLTTPVHSVQAARKRVHFRKAKHIFRKCSFCIEGNDRKATASPTRTRTAVIPMKDANGTAKSH